MRINEMPHPGSCRFYHKGDWELFIFYTERGTRSEGAFGMLLHQKNIYEPYSEKDKVIDTDLGKMKYYGLVKSPPWEYKGWLFESDVPRSDEK